MIMINKHERQVIESNIKWAKEFAAEIALNIKWWANQLAININIKLTVSICLQAIKQLSSDLEEVLNKIDKWQDELQQPQEEE